MSKTLWEHREMVEYGADPTACPSNRIPWQEVIDLAVVDTEARRQIGVIRQQQLLQGAVLANKMQDVRDYLVAFGVLSPNVEPLKPALTGS